MNRNLIIVIAIVILALIAFVVLRPEPEPEPSVEEPVMAPPPPPPLAVEEEPDMPEPTPPPVEPEVAKEPPVPVPASLDTSDALVPLVLEKLSPPLLQWVVPEEQVRKLVLAIDVLADGKLPQRHKPIAYEMPAFKVIKQNGDLKLSEDNLDRLTPLVNAVTEIDPKTLGQYYQAWLPTMEKAYAELGKGETFKARVDRLVKRIQAVGPAPEGAELVRPSVLYEYADPELENRSAVDKWLWRMGDENREKIQSYLRELKFYL